MLFNIIYKYN